MMKAPVRPDDPPSLLDVGLQVVALAWAPWLFWAETLTRAKLVCVKPPSEKPPVQETEFEFVP
jgi:hypothetical protein